MGYRVNILTFNRGADRFGDNILDFISLGGSITAQKGSSGGSVINGSNELTDVVVTSSDGETTAERDLRAITLSHIERSLKENNGFGLEVLLFGDLSVKSNLFNLSTTPELTELLINELKKNNIKIPLCCLIRPVKCLKMTC
ncbi:hypothetical protein IIB50_00295 [Patescibacteria group bacterium]|nr:hypothetical protein [Patescibacteria group bacterium]